jgi:hypothetical protein
VKFHHQKKSLPSSSVYFKKWMPHPADYLFFPGALQPSPPVLVLGTLSERPKGKVSPMRRVVLEHLV